MVNDRVVILKEFIMSEPESTTEAFQKLPEIKQAKIFAAAIDEFSQHGFSNASMNSLVESAGISKGSIFVYFKSKSGLFDYVVDTAVSAVKKYLRSVRTETENDPFADRLETLLRSGFIFIDDHPRIARIYFEMLQSNDAPSGSDIVRSLNISSCNFIEELLLEGITKGDISADIDTGRTAFLVNTLFEKTLRSYYNEHLAPEIGLFRADKENIGLWLKAIISLINNGISNT